MGSRDHHFYQPKSDIAILRVNRMNKDEVIIEPHTTEPILAGLSKYRELIYFFTWREFKVRYKEATLGIIWIVLQPILFMLLVNFIIVQRLGTQFGDGSIPSSLLIFIGLITWQLFEPSFAGTINSFLSNQALFKKLYLPKVVPAIASMISRLVDFSIAFVVLILLGLIFGHPVPLLTVALLIPSILLLLLTAYGGGLFLGSLNIKYRDLKQAIPFMFRLLFFGSPIIWPLFKVPDLIRPYFYLNPAAAAITTLRRSWYDPSQIEWQYLWMPFVTMAVLLYIGIKVYKRSERSMVDIA